MRAGATPFDLIAVWVLLVRAIYNEQEIATSVSPPVSDERVVLYSLFVSVNESIPDFMVFLHDASACCGFFAAQRAQVQNGIHFPGNVESSSQPAGAVTNVPPSVPGRGSPGPEELTPG